MVVGIILMIAVLLLIIGMVTGVIPGFEDFIGNISDNPWARS